MKPSEILLVVPPLCATFGKTEIECAAAYLVRTLAVTGDNWRAVSWPEVQTALRADVANNYEPIVSLLRNPFARPDFHALVEKGFATKTGEGLDVRFDLTAQAIERMRPWYRAALAKAEGGGNG